MSGFGGQVFSISASGKLLFSQETLSSTIGGILVDLVSAPIDPGDYRLHIKTGFGGVEIFLPHYVQYTIEGGSGFGGRDTHNGTKSWNHMRQQLQGTADLPHDVPPYAQASHEEHPVTIRFEIETGLGGVDIYKL